MPRLACPECRTDLPEPAGDRVECAVCLRVFERRDGVWRFLTPARHAKLDPFLQQYRIVREREGRRPSTADYYRSLPSVALDDPYAGDWRIRRETYHHLLRHVLAQGPQPIRVLDVGAGSGWLSHRLAGLGHRVVAVDAIDDEVDGLGATRHYATMFTLVQADFDALPFSDAQFDRCTTRPTRVSRWPARTVCSRLAARWS
jgi:SAM-dependent methyltransferase